MLIGLEKTFLFVANTKTASTSIERALLPFAELRHGGNPRRKHVSLADGLRSYGDVVGDGHDIFKFGVMRDPVDWILSWYRYRRANDVESPLPEDMSFEAFWQQGDWNIWRTNTEKFLQSRMFIDGKGQVIADAIIPYHRLGDVFGQIADALGIPSDLPRENVSKTRHTGDISPGLLEDIKAFYAEDYALFERLDAINADGLARLREGGPFLSLSQG